MSRAPDFGRLSPNVYYLQGFSGHGVALAGLAGKLAGEAIAGTANVSMSSHASRIGISPAAACSAGHR